MANATLTRAASQRRRRTTDSYADAGRYTARINAPQV